MAKGDDADEDGGVTCSLPLPAAPAPAALCFKVLSLNTTPRHPSYGFRLPPMSLRKAQRSTGHTFPTVAPGKKSPNFKGDISRGLLKTADGRNGTERPTTMVSVCLSSKFLPASFTTSQIYRKLARERTTRRTTKRANGRRARIHVVFEQKLG